MRVYLEIKDEAIVVKPIMTIARAFGMIKTKKTASQEAYDQAVKKAVVKKFAKQ